MRPAHKTTVPTFTACLAAIAITGCASVAVTDDALVTRTAFALGLERDSFTIENRVDDGHTTRYSVRTKQGVQHNCFVGGAIGITGRVVSEAICSKKGEAPKNPLLR